MARLSGGVQCTRVVLFVLNILFVICGFILLGFGIFLKVSKKLDAIFPNHTDTKLEGDSGIKWVALTLIILAAFTIVLSAFGCLGAVFKNRCFLYLYSIILTLLIIVEIAAFIVTFTSRNRVHDSYKSGFGELFKDTYHHNRTDLQYFIENLEHQLKCCGVQNVSDYYNNNFTVPSTCHENQDPGKPVFNQGCADAAIDWVWNQLPIIGGVLGGVLLIEIFGVISAIALGVAMSRSSDDEVYLAQYR